MRLSLAALACLLPAVALAAAPPVSLPPSESTAAARLDASPRHGEFVRVPLGEGRPELRTWVVYPEKSGRAGVVVLIHEIYGLSDWMRGVADQVAAEGWIAVVPDLLTGLGPGGGGTESVSTRDSVVQMVRQLSREEAGARLDAVSAWARKLPSANGKLATMGFCWGGSRSFERAAATIAPEACVVFYGSSPDSATLASVRAPVLGLYGGDDARVNTTIEPARMALTRSKRTYVTHVYDGAGHGFLRQQEGREGANQKAAEQAWAAVRAFLSARLR